jgi:hypothetical protein
LGEPSGDARVPGSGPCNPTEGTRHAGEIEEAADGRGAALAAKRGEKSKSSLRGASRSMAKSMSEAELERMASVKRKRLPTKRK